MKYRLEYMGLAFIAVALFADAAVCFASTDGKAADYEQMEQAVRAAVDRVDASVVRLETVGGLERGEGIVFGAGPTTGLIVDAEGHIVSSEFNFLSRPDSILVRFADGRRRAARLVATDHSRKLVLLKADFAEGETVELAVPETIGRRHVRVGQTAIAVGRTFPGNRPNICVGIVSAVNRVWGTAIQTDAATSPNNYGGSLADSRGRVMGVLVPLDPDNDSQIAGLKWYDSGIGFAVPADDVWRSVEKMKKGRDLYGGFLGVAFKGANPSISEPIIGACAPQSPAEKAGFKPGDRIVRIDGREIRRAADALEAVRRHYVGDTVAMTIERGGREFRAEVELSKKTKMRKRDKTESAEKNQGK